VITLLYDVHKSGRRQDKNIMCAGTFTVIPWCNYHRRENRPPYAAYFTRMLVALHSSGVGLDRRFQRMDGSTRKMHRAGLPITPVSPASDSSRRGLLEREPSRWSREIPLLRTTAQMLCERGRLRYEVAGGPPRQPALNKSTVA
jgi:hypothetical protein